MAAGECWIFDTWRQHSVQNDAEQARIHLVCDTVGGEGFWDLVACGRNHRGQALGPEWRPRSVDLDGPEPELRFERVNVPAVMSPWEMTRKIGFLLGEAQSSPVLPRLQDLAARLCRRWTELWAAFGEDPEGWPAYREALDRYVPAMQQAAGALPLRNQIPFSSALFTLIAKVAVGGLAERASARSLTAAAGQGRDPQFRRPIFLVSSPRSGSTLVFETLARAPGLFTIGGESHEVIEGVPELSPVHNGLGSNRLTGQQATAKVAEVLRERFWRALKDRDGRAPATAPVRMLEKTPKNALRVPFLDNVFPEAEFVFLHRDVRQTLGSMTDAWNSQRFCTYPSLPGWTGLRWSLLLVPGWQQLVGRPLAEVVARQWQTAMETLLDDLTRLPPQRVHVLTYDAFLADPDAEMRRLCSALGLEWDRPIEGALPLSRFTLSPPDPDKWRRHEAAIEAQLPSLAATLARLERFLAGVRDGGLGDNG